MQDYKSVSLVVIICATLVNTQTHIHTIGLGFVHFTVCRFICVYLCVFCVFVLYSIVGVLL